MLAEAMLADWRAQAVQVCWCRCTACTTQKVPLRRIRLFFLVVQAVHFRQHTRAARVRKYANMVSANIVPILPTVI